MFKQYDTNRFGPIPPVDPELEKLLKQEKAHGRAHGQIECPAKPKSVDFWEQHGAALRAGRLVYAAAIMCAGDEGYTVEGGVARAFEIEKEVQHRIQQEKK